MYRVIEVARMLGVSKVTVYKKISKNKKSLKNHVHTRSNITYIDDAGVEIIKNTIDPVSGGQDYSDLEIRQMVMDDLSNTIVLLNQQVEIKKKQIQKRDDIIEHYKSTLKSIRGRIQYLESKSNLFN